MAFADQLGFSFRAPERRVWAVRALVAAARTHLEREYSDIWVEGEISNFRAHESSGHLYFTLKDEDSQIKAVMFRSQARQLRFRPEDGMQVVLRGRVTIYEGRGELQLSAEYRTPAMHRHRDFATSRCPARHPQHSAQKTPLGERTHLSGAGARRDRFRRGHCRRQLLQSRKN